MSPSNRVPNLVIAALLVTGCSSELFGQSTTFRFTGKVRTVDAPLGDEVKVGDACTVDVTFDPNTDPVFAGLPWYPVLSSSFTIHAAAGDLTASSTEGPQERIVVNDRQGAFQTDQWLWGAGSADGFGGTLESFALFSVGGMEILDYNIHLTDNSATAFSTDSLPLNLDLTAFQNRQGFAQFGMAGHDIRFSVDTFEILGGSATPPAGQETEVKPLSFSLAASGEFTATWQVEAGVTYQFASSSNLETWTVAGEMSSDEGVISFTFPNLTASPTAAFYSIQKKD